MGPLVVKQVATPKFTSTPVTINDKKTNKNDTKVVNDDQG